MSEIQQGLLIAVIGMGLVFAVIIFLWGMMALLLRLTSVRKVDQDVENPPTVETDLTLLSIQGVENQRRAAAAAVAVQFAITAGKTRNERSRRQEPPQGLSAWQTAHRTRQLEHNQTQG